MSEKIKVTQIKSSIRTIKKQQDTLKALGLRGIGKSVICDNSSAMQGMVGVVSHLVSVEDA